MTGQPTPEFRRRHDVDPPAVDASAFRQGWRVRSRLDQLLADRLIAPGQWQAAVEFRNAYERARELPGSTLFGHVSLPGPRQPSVERLVAATRVRRVALVIGPLATALVIICAVADATWASTARQVGVDPKTVRAWTALAIRALAVAWGEWK